jgi:tRNA pseudouridine55 synthase
MEGKILVDKPEGWTSFDVCNYVRRMVATIEGKKPRNVKVGHTGTLDPAATGLLMLCIGKATKQVPALIKQDKTYEVELTLGQTSTTGDREGELITVGSNKPTQNDIEVAIKSFVGEIEQTPPIFSAIKINGKRAYDLARAGKEVEMKSRKVIIHSINNVTYDYPKITFETRVGSGTYIRSLAVDIGEKLSTGAYMSNLKRTSIGEASVDDAYPVKELTSDVLQKILACNR